MRSRRLFVFAAALVILSGCAAIQEQVATDSAEILAQAGFERQPLDQPGLPARQLVDDAGVYKFADPDFCRCVYFGGRNEYAELQRLRAERVAEREWIRGRMVASMTMDRTIWGPWKPEGLEVTRRESGSPARSAAAR